jgi:hypothetical protein
MKPTSAAITTFLTAFSLLTATTVVHAQTPAAGQKPKFTAEQRAALDALYEHGGILIHLDEQRPGQPLVMVDFAGHPEFQDDWLQHLRPFPELTTVRLSGTAISDAGLAQVSQLPKLAELVLKDTPITDDGLTRLAACSQLKSLDVRGTQVSPTGVAQLRKKLPTLFVEASPPKMKLTPEQALAELKKTGGGMLVHYDDRLPGTPVVMIDATNLLQFQDEWTRYFAFLPSLRTVSLSGTPLTDAGLDGLAEVGSLQDLILKETKITDAGLAKLAKCKNLKTLNVEGTGITEAGVAALRRALPQLEVNGKSEPVGTDNVWLDGRSVVPFAEATRRNSTTASGDGVVKQFTAAEIKQWRKKLNELSQLPEATPNGWSKSRVDPSRLLTVFPELQVRDGYVLRAYVFKEEANSNGFVWALPADAEFPEPVDCPRLESHFLKPPKPFDALDDMMEAVAGNDSPESYLRASILRREFKEFGSGWHGIKWGMNTVLDNTPWNPPPRDVEDEGPTFPESKPAEWKWFAPNPGTWKPEVRFEKNKAIVTFYSYTPLYAELDNGEEEKERIVRHTETYRRGNYRPLVVEKKLAEGPHAVAH